jgi:hypothetical protein
MTETNYTTRDMGLATFISYVRPELHIATVKTGPFSSSFESDDPTACAELASAFYGRAGVDDAKGLLECARDVKNTIRRANDATDGAWRREQA